MEFTQQQSHSISKDLFHSKQALDPLAFAQSLLDFTLNLQYTPLLFSSICSVMELALELIDAP